MNYRVIKSKRKTLSLQIKDGEIVVRAPLNISDSTINGFVEKHAGWIDKQRKRFDGQKKKLSSIALLSQEERQELAARAREIFSERADIYAERLGVSYKKISVRFQRSRWGSCSAKGNLSFNCLLLFAPSEVLDSVVAHELCHLKFMDHSKNFYRELLTVFPEYHKWHSWLKENGDALVMRIKQKER